MHGWIDRPTADVGGVGGPVACSEALLGDGDVGMDAEGMGGDPGGELEQCGAAGLAGMDPEGAEPLC
jgi:hypothetical protein